ncbi:hypothetical protein HK100_008231, partial [Physocladia obscura]
MAHNSIPSILTRLFELNLQHAHDHIGRTDDDDDLSAEYVIPENPNTNTNTKRTSRMVKDEEAKWMLLFVEFFLPESTLYDDLLFFVSDENDVLVKRKVSGGKMPSLDEKINWMETFFLNLIVQMHCSLTVSVCKRDSSLSKRKFSTSERVLGGASNTSSPIPTSTQNTQNAKTKMIALRRVTKKVYAAPYKSRMDVKDAFMNECAYPLVYYTVNDYESTDLQLHIQEREYLCVELSVLVPAPLGDVLENELDYSSSVPISPPVSVDSAPFPIPDGFKKVVLFQGAVPYTALLDIFLQKGSTSSASNVAASRRTSKDWGNLANNKGREKTERTEYIMMRGPRGKGVCQVAICENILSGPDDLDTTPSNSWTNSYTVGTSASSPAPSSLLNILGGTVRTGISILRNGISATLGDGESGSPSNSNGSLSNSPFADFRKPEALKCSMTYVNVPWHSIISRKVMQTATLKVGTTATSTVSMTTITRGFAGLSLGRVSGLGSGLSMMLTKTGWPASQFGVVLVSVRRGNAGTKKKKLRPVQLRNAAKLAVVKVASKRKGKHYKLKNHRGAVSRWLIKSPKYARGVLFKRAQAGNSHLNRKNRAWKSRSKRQRVTANSQQNKLLKKLIPYY